VGRLFGPVMILWFVVLAVTGVRAIMLHPRCWLRSIRATALFC